MSTYYTHSRKSVEDLIAGRVKQIPFVVLADGVDESKFKDLFLIIKSVDFGVIQVCPNSLPYFVIGDADQILVAKKEGDKPDVEVRAFVDTYGEIKPKITESSNTGIMNDVMDLHGLFDYLFNAFKTMVEDNFCCNVEEFKLIGPIGPSPNPNKAEEEIPFMRMRNIDVPKPVFERFLKDSGFAKEEYPIPIFAKRKFNASHESS